jgi:hypothetical protein
VGGLFQFVATPATFILQHANSRDDNRLRCERKAKLPLRDDNLSIGGSFMMVGMASRLQRFMLRSINIWPPLLAAGIHVRWGDDMCSADVEMRMHFWNRNYVGTHYGGSLYSMTDPFYMLMLMENLGRDYIVWDKAATIRFRKPGKGTVRAEFRLTQEQLGDIRDTLTSQEKYEPTFLVEVKDSTGTVVAEVQKILHIRRKPTVESVSV